MFSAGLALALMALQLGAIALSPSGWLVRVTLPSTIVGVPLALWPHRRYAGIWVMFVGLAANLAVVLANGGLMPIERSTVASAVGNTLVERYEVGSWIHGSKDVLVEPGHGRGLALGDGIVIRFGGRGLVASPGDIVIWAGLTMIAGEVIWSRLRRIDRTQAQRLVSTRAAGGGATTP